MHSTWHSHFKAYAQHQGVRPPAFPRVSGTRYVSYDNMARVMLDNSALIDGFLEEHFIAEVDKSSRDELRRLGDPYVALVMSIMSHSLKGFSLPYMKEMATINDLSTYRDTIGHWESELRKLYSNPSALAKFFTSTTPTKKVVTTTSGEHQQQRQQRRQRHQPQSLAPEKLPASRQDQLKVLALNKATLQHPRYCVEKPTDHALVLQLEWIRSALYMMVKHNSKFLHAGEYSKIQDNLAMRATNRSGERIFSTLNRIIASHPNIREPIISGIIKIRTLGAPLFKNVHAAYATPGTWAQARELLASCPRQRDFCNKRYEHWRERSLPRQQARRRSMCIPLPLSPPYPHVSYCLSHIYRSGRGRRGRSPC